MTTETTTEIKEVMVRLPAGYHRKLEAIAEIEARKAGPQARKLVQDGIDNYLASHPEIASQFATAS